MGKLHKLRKEIERNPKRWFFSNKFGKHYIYIYGARFIKDYEGYTKIIPVLWYCPNYKKFVQHVLRELGHIV